MSEEQKEKVNPLVKRDGTPVALEPTTLEEGYRLAVRLANSEAVPIALQGKPDSVFAVMLKSIEIGIPIMAGLSNIMVINGRASIWGELFLALIRRSGKCAYFNIAGDDKKCYVKAKRTDTGEEMDYTYTIQDAERSGLLEKDKEGKFRKETWHKYPKDMLQWKATNRLAKLLFPDVIFGLVIREIADEETQTEAPVTESVTIKPEPQPEPSPNEQEKTIQEIEPESEPELVPESPKGIRLVVESVKKVKDKNVYTIFGKNGEKVKTLQKPVALQVHEMTGKEVEIFLNNGGDIEKVVELVKND